MLMVSMMIGQLFPVLFHEIMILTQDRFYNPVFLSLLHPFFVGSVISLLNLPEKEQKMYLELKSSHM